MSLGELREAAIVATIVDRVAKLQRFCGETFLQKSAFFLKELFGLPLSAQFRLYHFGPFSFDFRDQLYGMEADDFVKIRPHEYGATYVPGERFALLQSHFVDAISENELQIEFAVRELSKLNVKDLEALATALYVTKRQPGQSVEVRAQELHEIKKHVEMAKARKSIEQVDAWMSEHSAVAVTR